jgi:hypothetical protein
MNKPLLVAVDPGVSGAVVTYHDNLGLESYNMPGTDWEVCKLVADITTKANKVVLYLEEPPLYAGRNIPGSAIGKLMWNTGVLYGAAVACGWEVHRVRPAIWQKATANIGTKGDLSTTAWKNKLKARAGELYGSVPGLKVTLANADALLILDAAMRGAIN